jgi:hypothetical protein
LVTVETELAGTPTSTGKQGIGTHAIAQEPEQERVEVCVRHPDFGSSLLKKFAPFLLVENRLPNVLID